MVGSISQPGSQSAHSPIITSPVFSSTLLAHHASVESNVVHLLWVIPLCLNGKTQFFPFTDLHPVTISKFYQPDLETKCKYSGLRLLLDTAYTEFVLKGKFVKIINK